MIRVTFTYIKVVVTILPNFHSQMIYFLNILSGLRHIFSSLYVKNILPKLFHGGILVGQYSLHDFYTNMES